MEPEEKNEEMETEETTPQEKVAEFATSVADKAKMVESGEMSVEDFVAECMSTLEMMNTETDGEESPMGGLGANSGKFPLPEAE